MTPRAQAKPSSDDAFRAKLEDLIAGSKESMAFFRLCGLYQSASPEQREMIRSGWSFGKGWTLPKLETLCHRDQRQPAPEWRAWVALLYHSIEDGRHDWRDNLVSICVIHHSLLRLNLDPEEPFTKAAALSSSTTSARLLEWLARRPEDQSLEAFSWVEEMTPDGPVFRYG